MIRALPPLNALRAFEASARHLSFTLAAKELFVTQTAVSHQIKSLEEYLGTQLFKRLPRKLILTEQGAQLLYVATRCLDDIASVSESIRNPGSYRKLTVSITPAFGTQWLVPRLGRFWRLYPDIELKLHHSVQLSNFSDDVDMAVRAGTTANWPGVEAEHLMSLDLIPVCAPTLANGRQPPQTPDELSNHTLLHESDFEDWAQWLRSAGNDTINARHGPLLGDSSATILAAIAGEGISLVRSVFVKEHVKSGRLVLPFALSVSDTFCYYVVYPRGSLTNPAVAAFRDFLFSEQKNEEE
ncbi:hypothetical protein AB833_04340 [Chromatiales bacterium (ex Bugula neritina AB1)]|nr:hypothetical protein AB833_04340 [Chromatiales bacterium (ex Bugula neritina AB1)]